MYSKFKFRQNALSLDKTVYSQKFLCIKQYQMGNQLYGCSPCSTVNLPQKHEPNQISQYYMDRLGVFNQSIQGIPFYDNINYSRLVNDLRSRDQKFQDMIQPYEHLLNNPNIQWKRLSAIYPKQKFSRAPGYFQFQYIIDSKKKYSAYPLAKDLQHLSKFPDLITKLFANVEVSKQGFYVLYFSLGGNIQKRVQIVIDDYVPISSRNKYLFQQPRQGDGIWMILIQKAWAKILKSYLQIQHFDPYHLLSEMTGVPRPEIYEKGDFLMSLKYDFSANESKYIKITRDQPVQLLLSIWTQFQSINLIELIDLKLEVIIETEDNESKYQMLPIREERINNQIVFTRQSNQLKMFELKKGQNIIHIYNRSQKNIQFNFVIHSKKPVSAHTRSEKQFQIIKTLMVQNQYKKVHHTIGIQYEFPGIQLRFCWMKHRGIFCFKNCSNETKKIQISIKKAYLKEIWFQDVGQLIESAILKPKNYGFFVVIRQEDKQYGPFYEITVKKA